MNKNKVEICKFEMHLKNFFVCALIQEKNANVARVILGNLRTTTTTGSELPCTAQARLVNFVVVVSSPTSNKTDLNFRWTATSFSRGDGRRLFLTLLTVLRMSQLKEISEVLVYFYNYDGVVSDEKFVPLYDEI